MTVADFFSSGTWLVIRNLLVFVAAIFWLSVAYWVYKDARRRVEDPWLVGTATLLGFVPFVGAGTGGSSALYGMALERLFPADLEPRRYHPAAIDSSLPERWPISYDELAAYYTKAERLYGVRGSLDPLRKDTTFGYVGDPPRYSPAAQELVSFLRKRGLHPYPLPLACNHVPGCTKVRG